MKDSKAEQLGADVPLMGPKELLWSAGTIMGLHAFKNDDVQALPLDELHWTITVSMYVTDVCLNEVKARGELKLDDQGIPIIPYNSDHFVHGTTLPNLVTRRMAGVIARVFKDADERDREQGESV